MAIEEADSSMQERREAVASLERELADERVTPFRKLDPVEILHAYLGMRDQRDIALARLSVREGK